MATTTFLNQLSQLYARSHNLGASGSASGPNNPWYILAAVAFNASNAPEAIPRVFEHALKELPPGSRVEDRLVLARKLREALFKSGLTCGYPRTINSLRALYEVMPEELMETQIQRDINAPLSENQARGQVLFDDMYGETGDSVQGLLDSIYPDMGWFSKTIGYGLVYSARPDILSPLETSFTLVAALIAVDAPQQISWHLANARRCGASLEEIQAARSIAILVGTKCGVRWKNKIPEIETQ